MDSTHNNAAEKVNEHRDDLEALAESDNPASCVARKLLDAADEHGDNE